MTNNKKMKKPSDRIQEIADRILKFHSDNTAGGIIITPELTNQINTSAIIEFLDEKFPATFEVKPPEIRGPEYDENTEAMRRRSDFEIWHKQGWNDCARKAEEEIQKIFNKGSLTDERTTATLAQLYLFLAELPKK